MVQTRASTRRQAGAGAGAVVDAPVVGAPVVDAPVVDAPVVDAPVVEPAEDPAPVLDVPVQVQDPVRVVPPPSSASSAASSSPTPQPLNPQPLNPGHDGDDMRMFCALGKHTNFFLISVRFPPLPPLCPVLQAHHTAIPLKTFPEPRTTYLDLTLEQLPAMIEKLRSESTFSRNQRLEWNVGELVDFDSHHAHTLLTPHRPPLIMYHLDQSQYIESTQRGWQQFYVILGKTGLPRRQAGKEFLAKCRRRWGKGRAGEEDAEKEAHGYVAMNVVVKHWLEKFQSLVKKSMNEKDPKPLEIAALKLKVT